MNEKSFEQLRQDIVEHESNRENTEKGYLPLFQASATSKIVVIGQAPGIRAQTSGVPWDDASGKQLMSWLGVDQAQFRDPAIFALIPMDFYYPGKGKSGDLPPRKSFAPLWHGRVLDLMPEVELVVLVGGYAQKYYLPGRQSTLTETVRNYQRYLPEYFPIVHPSPLNFRWHAKNRWFEQEVVPELRKLVRTILA